tara:strand:+ start:272 stop:475 length:204 start_codon:yes stop_codon:yes gene_type:complete
VVEVEVVFGLIHQEEMQEQVVQVEAETQTIQEQVQQVLLELSIQAVVEVELQDIQLQVQEVLVEVVW